MAMRLKLIILQFAVIDAIAAVENELVFDYFAHKKPPRIVGFTCYTAEDNASLMRKFSHIGIAAIFGRIDDELIHRSICSDHHKLGVYIDMRCQNTETANSVIAQASWLRLYNELHYWLVMADCLSDAKLVFADAWLDLHTDLAVAVKSFTKNQYDLYDFYNPFKLRGGKLNVTHMGYWSENDGLRVTLTQDKYRRRSDLHGLVWKVAFFGSKYRPKKQPLIKHLDDLERTGKKDGLIKFGYGIVKPVADMLNLTVVLAEYSKWNLNDRMGPMTKALQFDEIDVSGAPISAFSEKVALVKFVYTAWPFRTCFIFRTPQLKDIKVGEVFNPLALHVWYLLGVMSIIFLLVLTFNLQFENNDYIYIQYSNAFILTIGCFCLQGTNFNFKEISTRIVFLSVMLFSLLMYNYYSAAVVSARLNEPIYKLNDSLDSLAQTDLQVASEPMLYFNFFMKENAKQTEMFDQRKWQKLAESDRFILPEKGMKLVKAGGFAYHTHPEVGYPYVNRLYENREICELTEIHLAKPSYRSIAVPYNSSFTEITKQGFTKLTEVGIRNRQLRRWKSRKPVCRKDVLSATSITILEFAPHLILLTIGMILCIVLFMMELFIGNYKLENIRWKSQIKFKKQFFY